METRQIDVSQLAELSALALLAAKVKLALGRVGRSGTASEGERRRIEGAIRYLDRLLDGLRQYRTSDPSARPTGPDQLYAIATYLTAAPALLSAANHGAVRLHPDEMAAMEATLTAMKGELESALSASQVQPSQLKLADGFFAALADYVNAEHDRILRAPAT